MGIISVIGRVVDKRDRAFLGGLCVIVLGVGATVVAGAGLLGLAFRVFEAAAGS